MTKGHMTEATGISRWFSLLKTKLLLHSFTYDQNNLHIATFHFFLYTILTMFKKKDNKNSDEIILEDGDQVTHTAAQTTTTDIDLDDSVVGEENAAETIKKLREKLKKVEAEKLEYLTGWQRAKADHINARKREEEDKKDFVKFANERLIEGLTPVLESFEMAMGNKEAWEKTDKNWRVGVEYIYGQLKKVLEDSGLTELRPLNQKFDHSVHEAASYEPVTDEKLDHVVLKVIQNGYYLNGKLMRPAKVVVGEFKK